MIDEKLLAPVRTEVTVPLSPAQAFDLFTDGLDRWWLRGYKIGAAPMRRAVLEPRSGGRWYEIDEDGAECDWGRVVDWDPPHRLLLHWQITPEWTYDPDLVTEVDVTFTAVDEASTTVVVEHRNMDRYGAAAEEMRLTFSGPNGWSGLLRQYAQAAAA